MVELSLIQKDHQENLKSGIHYSILIVCDNLVKQDNRGFENIYSLMISTVLLRYNKKSKK